MYAFCVWGHGNQTYYTGPFPPTPQSIQLLPSGHLYNKSLVCLYWFNAFRSQKFVSVDDSAVDVSSLTQWVCAAPTWPPGPGRGPAGYTCCRTGRLPPPPWSPQDCPGTRRSSPRSVNRALMSPRCKQMSGWTTKTKRKVIELNDWWMVEGRLCWIPN